MNKIYDYDTNIYETSIGNISNSGLRIYEGNASTITGKVVINNVEVTDIDSWNKALDTFTNLKQQLEKKDKEIEKLNHECDTYMKIATKRGNIINELEKDLEEVFDKMKEKQVGIGGRGYYYTDLIPIENILDKLKELKEGK